MVDQSGAPRNARHNSSMTMNHLDRLFAAEAADTAAWPQDQLDSIAAPMRVSSSTADRSTATAGALGSNWRVLARSKTP